MEEEWRDIEGFEGIYQISNLGRICSFKQGTKRILSIKNSKGDYLTIILQYQDKVEHTRIHRIVYETFIGEIPKGYEIHHKDGNKQNNKVDNLRLLSIKEHHKIHLKKNPHLIDGMINYNKYIKTNPIYQYSLNGTFIAKYSNGQEASKATGVCQRNILQVANKEPYDSKGHIRKQAGGYIWKFN